MDIFTEKANSVLKSLKEYMDEGEELVYSSEEDMECPSEDAETASITPGEAKVVGAVNSLNPNPRNPKIAQTQQEIDKIVDAAGRIITSIASKKTSA